MIYVHVSNAKRERGGKYEKHKDPQKNGRLDDSDNFRGRCSSWVLGVVTVNKLSRLFSDHFQCGPKKSVPVR